MNLVDDKRDLIDGILRIGDRSYRIEERPPRNYPTEFSPIATRWHTVTAWRDGIRIAEVGCMDGDTGRDWAVGAVLRRCFADSRLRRD